MEYQLSTVINTVTSVKSKKEIEGFCGWKPKIKSRINLATWCYNAGRPFSLSCMRVMALPVKSRSTCTVSRWSCRDSRTNSCWVSASCCTDSDRSSKERDTVSSRMLVACCSWRLSDAFWSMLSLTFALGWPVIGSEAVVVELPEEVWGCSCLWRPLFPWWSPLSLDAWLEGRASSLASSSQSAKETKRLQPTKTKQKCCHIKLSFQLDPIHDNSPSETGISNCTSKPVCDESPETIKHQNEMCNALFWKEVKIWGGKQTKVV